MVALGPHHLPPSPPGRHCSLRPHTRARCPPVSSSMSSRVFICSPTMSSYVPLLCSAIHYILICIPRCSFVSSLMSSCVFISHVLLLCHHVFLCLLMSSSYVPLACPLACLAISFSLVLLYSPSMFPCVSCYNPVFSCALIHVVILSSCRFCVFIELFRSSIFHTNMFILCPHLTRIFYSVNKQLKLDSS